ncbi:TetR/AcrR family transcriptional regulator [Naasia sp. SYSU D00948]|uniref:TetR/AcrR family transcriptional regulator n=1 Tax=Naasia sp. SYSU D00948 TaxID=2817379 RepID=UPI001B305EAD|nr:TetR/AcrR family transcriptional regulator [Naasia sp. SYSU D00948]
MPRPTGRPRAQGESPTGLGTREDILQAGARLFCDTGYGSTSTHALAREAGVRQATLYHYFAGKHEVLLELLLGTVAPSLATARTLLDRPEPAAARLWALCASDVRLLSGGDVNVGSLYLLPELADPRFAEFHARRAELQETYAQLVAQCSPDPAWSRRIAPLVLDLVESVILQRRRDADWIDEESGPMIANAALRIVGLGEQAAEAAADAGRRILAGLPEDEDGLSDLTRS